ncbi:MAG: 5'/3'-nucleotidase SurE, partial [Acidimicrobiales bacterium]
RNVGRAVLHSGTVGAALTAVHFNRRGLAVSIQSGPFRSFESATDRHIHFETAAAIAVSLAESIAEMPTRTVINCNVPNLPMAEVKGVRQASLARSGLIRSALVDAEGGEKMQLELAFGDTPPGDESDEALTAAGYITVTPLASVSEDQRPDVRSAMAGLITAGCEELVGLAAKGEAAGAGRLD